MCFFFKTDCQSGNCKEDASTSFYGRCRLAEDGKSCTRNNQCESGICSTSSNSCEADTKDLIESCKKDDECESDLCQDGRCRGKVGDTCQYYDECGSRNCGSNGRCEEEKKENGSNCLGNTNCESNFCYQGKCVSPQKENGYPCTQDIECLSFWCNAQRCAISGSNNVPNGQFCNVNSSCISNNCSNGVCQAFPGGVGNKQNGEICRDNTECISNYCNFFSDRCEGGGNSHHALRQNGEGCQQDIQCQSNWCNSATRSCQQKLQTGSSCQQNNECLSNWCNNQRCTSNEFVGLRGKVVVEEE